jgi:hypothetical protein
MKTVLIYVDTNKKVGDVDHLKVFANTGAADRWFDKNDPDGVAFRYKVLKGDVELPLEIRAPKGKKTTVSNGELTSIFFQKMRAYSECPYSGTPSIEPDSWKWTVDLDEHTSKYGEAKTQAMAITAVVLFIDWALG